MESKYIQIAIDGPAGSGKSSIAKKLTEYLPNFIHINTGAMYRAVAYYYIKNKIDYNNEFECLTQLQKINIKFIDNEICILENNNSIITNVNEFINNEKVAVIASKIATYPKLRAHLVKLQQYMALCQNIIMDGRDIGSVVLPNATLKVFIDASVEERSWRRLKDENLDSIKLDEVKNQIQQRDYNDYNRVVGALKRCDDALLIVNDDLTIEQCCEIIVKALKVKTSTT